MKNTKRVSVRTIAKAMLRDTTKKTKRQLVVYRWDPKTRLQTIGASCAIGGAALTLGIDPDDLQDALADVDRDGVPPPKKGTGANLGEAIYGWNDTTNLTKAEIGQMVLDNADRKTLNTMLEVSKA